MPKPVSLLAAALLCLLLPVLAVAEKVVVINETNFPDANFRNYVKKYDTSGDSQLSETEINAVTSISVKGKNITTLQGIEYFTALQTLDCSSTPLTSLDVSHNAALTELVCTYNQLTSLDISKNTALEKLVCDLNRLTTLNVRNNIALNYLNCSNNQLTTLDVSKNDALNHLNCSVNPLTALDVSKNDALNYLDCTGNQLTTLDVSHNLHLERLECYNNKLTALDIRANAALKELRCDVNQLTALDVSENPLLEKLYCTGNQLTALDFGENAALNYLNCSGNLLTTLDVSENAALEYLICSDNRLTELNVSKNTSLISLNCSNNQLTTLDVSKNPSLKSLICTNNHLTSLDLSSNTVLELAELGSNRCTVTVGPDRTFDLKNLPGGFNVDKASGWKGGTVSGPTLTVDSGAKEVTYTYLCGTMYGNPATFSFTLLIDTRPDGEVTDAAPAAPATVPTLVLPTGQSPAGTLLKYELRTDATPNTVAYDVDYTDLGGNKLPLPGGSMLCFPYPEGLDETSLSAYRIVIRHEMDNGKTEVFSSEDGQVRLTKQGICIRVSSLSPFTISWEALPPELPQTGDTESPGLWLALLALSASALALLLRRRAA